MFSGNITQQWRLVLLAMTLFGCSSNQTETGYSPKKIGMGDNDIRSIYAAPFSPESRMTEQSKKPDFGRNIGSPR